MPPDTLDLAFFILQEAIKAEPAIAAEVQTLLAKGDPTDADWAALRTRIKAKTYKDLVPDTGLSAADLAPGT